MIHWFKSSYSGGDNDCVEVAHIAADFRKSGHSAGQSACVEIARVPAGFRKSSHSYGQSNCFEVAAAPASAAIRDTKHRDLGALTFSSGEWRVFIDAVRSDRL